MASTSWAAREVYGNASCFQFEKSNETDGWCTTPGGTLL